MNAQKKRSTVLALTTVLCLCFWTFALEAKTNSQSLNGHRAAAVILKLREGATPEQLSALKELSSEIGLRIEKRLLKGGALRMRIQNKDYKNQEQSVVDAIKATGAVDFVEKDSKLFPSALLNDSLYSSQWHLNRIGAEAAWKFSAGVKNVKVAVCDAGFDITHPDLAPNLILPGYNTVTEEHSVSDSNPHGTQTSGVIAAVGNNLIGVAGVAWKVGVLPIQISNQPDGVSTYSEVAECIHFAADQGVKVVSISYDLVYTSAVTDEAAKYMRSLGGVVVVAAGNSTSDISYWGTSPNMLVVGSTDFNDQISWFSNFGKPVDLVAPGQGIYTTSSDGGYEMVDGTSFATPLVSGVAALIYSIKPTFTPAEVDKFILSTTVDLGLTGTDSTYAAGRLNAGAAVQKAVLAASPPVIIDNLPAGRSDASRSYTGKWCTATTGGSYGNASLASCGSGVDTYKFTPKISISQNHKIYIHYTSGGDRSTQANVVVKHATGSQTKLINMRTGGGTWVLLGTYKLNAGTGNNIMVSDSRGLATVDAVKLEAVP